MLTAIDTVALVLEASSGMTALLDYVWLKLYARVCSDKFIQVKHYWDKQFMTNE